MITYHKIFNKVILITIRILLVTYYDNISTFG